MQGLSVQLLPFPGQWRCSPVRPNLTGAAVAQKHKLKVCVCGWVGVGLNYYYYFNFQV